MSVSPVSAGFNCRCPRCGRGRLFSGYLKLADTCESCGLELGAMDSGDGPAVFVMFIVLVITVPLVFMVYAVFEPPMWVHAILWPIVVIGLVAVAAAPGQGRDDRPAIQAQGRRLIPMLSKLRFRPTLWPTLISVPAFIVLAACACGRCSACIGSRS
jgi:uncharacterized protein (DUF983 family)